MNASPIPEPLPARFAPRLVIVMGVSGCGKSTIAAQLAAELNAQFIEGDDLHPQANIEKMAAGHPLTDADREPWLDQIGAALRSSQGVTVATCSALKRAYRTRLIQQAHEPVFFVYLKGSRTVLADRMDARTGHFMPPSLLNTQLQTLEEPTQAEWQITLCIDQNQDAIVAKALQALRNP